MADSDNKQPCKNACQADRPAVDEIKDRRWFDVSDIHNLELEYPDSFCLQVLIANKLKLNVMTLPPGNLDNDIQGRWNNAE